MRILAGWLLLWPLCAVASGTASVTIYLAGDSTMAEKLEERRPETGWGEKLPKFFDAGVSVENHARDGLSTRTFIEAGRWKSLIDKVRPGDYVFIQFGHNDGRQAKDSYTPPDDFRRNLAGFVADVRARQATPVLLTPVMRFCSLRPEQIRTIRKGSRTTRTSRRWVQRKWPHLPSMRSANCCRISRGI